MERRMIYADDAYYILSDYYHHRTETQHSALKEALDKVRTAEPDLSSRCEYCIQNGGDADCDHVHCHIGTIRIEADVVKAIEDIGTIMDNLNEMRRILEAARVRCGGCEYYDNHDRRCKIWNHGVTRQDFCSYGKEREPCEPYHPNSKDLIGESQGMPI